MKVKKLLVLMMAALVLVVCLVGCGDTSSEQSGADSTKNNETSEAIYVGTFGKEVIFANLADYEGCEFDISMSYQTKDAEDRYVFTAVEQSADGRRTETFRITDDLGILNKLDDMSGLDDQVVKMRVVLDKISYIEYENDEITTEYEATVKEATFLEADSIEAKLAQSKYYKAGDRIDFTSGVSIYIIETGYLNNNGIYSAYVKAQVTNNGSEEVHAPQPNFYGDNNALDRSYLVDGSDIDYTTTLAPGRKIEGYYCAEVGTNQYSVIEADLGGAIILVDYDSIEISTETVPDDTNTEDAVTDNTTSVDLSYYGTYACDNGVDAVVEAEVSVATDTGEDCIYLAALYYDSNHYSAEVYGTMQMISENTFSVKDEITRAVELEVTFVDGGMDIKVTATESDEYKVLEGHYDMTSQLDFNEVG